MNCPRASSRLILFLGIYLFSLATLSIAHLARQHQNGVLIDEEVAVGFRNIQCQKHRVQWDHYSSNQSGNIFFTAMSYILPISTQSQRVAKVAVVALLPVIIAYIISILCKDVHYLGMLAPAVLFALLPNISWLSICLTENVLGSTFGLALLAIALSFEWSNRIHSILKIALFVLLAVWTTHLYGGSFIFVPLSLIVLWCRAFYMERPLAWTRKKAFCVYACILLSVVIGASWPFAYYNHPHLTVVRGGAFLPESWADVVESVTTLYYDLFVRSESLLANSVPFATFQWERGGALVILLALIGIVVSKRFEGTSWIAVLLITSLIIGIIAASYPGVRRIIPAVISLCIFAGLGIEHFLYGEMKKWIQVSLLTLFATLVVSSLLHTYGDSEQRTLPQLHVTLSIIGAIAIAFSSWITKHRKKIVGGLLAIFCFVPADTFTRNYQHIYDWDLFRLPDTFAYIDGLGYEETIQYWSREMSKREIVFSEFDFSVPTVMMIKVFCERKYKHCYEPRIEYPEVNEGLRLCSA